jgi:hypothetical protein
MLRAVNEFVPIQKRIGARELAVNYKCTQMAATTAAAEQNTAKHKNKYHRPLRFLRDGCRPTKNSSPHDRHRRATPPSAVPHIGQDFPESVAIRLFY